MFQPDRLLLQSSRQLMGLGLVIALLALVALSLMQPRWLALLLLLVMLLYLVYLTRRYLLLNSPDSVVALAWDRQGWQVLLVNGDWLEVSLSPASVVHRQFMLLHFQGVEKSGGFKVPILADSGRAEGQRRLRVCVRAALQRGQRSWGQS